MDHGGSAVSEKSGTSAPPSRGEEGRLRDTERASGPASERVDDRGSRRVGTTEGRNDEGMI